MLVAEKPPPAYAFEQAVDAGRFGPIDQSA